jgi:hypothetical protein
LGFVALLLVDFDFKKKAIAHAKFHPSKTPLNPVGGWLENQHLFKVW